MLKVEKSYQAQNLSPILAPVSSTEMNGELQEILEEPQSTKLYHSSMLNNGPLLNHQLQNVSNVPLSDQPLGVN